MVATRVELKVATGWSTSSPHAARRGDVSSRRRELTLSRFTTHARCNTPPIHIARSGAQPCSSSMITPSGYSQALCRAVELPLALDFADRS